MCAVADKRMTTNGGGGVSGGRGEILNSRDGCPPGGFQDRCLKPLGHPSGTRLGIRANARAILPAKPEIFHVAGGRSGRRDPPLRNDPFTMEPGLPNFATI